MRSGKFFQSISLVTNNLVCHHFVENTFCDDLIKTWQENEQIFIRRSFWWRSRSQGSIDRLVWSRLTYFPDLLVRTVLGSLMKEGNHVRQTEGEFSFHCEGRNVHVHHVTINNYVIHGSESSPRQTHNEEQHSKNKGPSQNFFSKIFGFIFGVVKILFLFF